MSKIKWRLRNIKTGGVIELKNSLSRAGRLPFMQIKCISNLVSREHANFFILEDGSLRVMDQNTTNGTYVNGVRINGREIVKLKSGDNVSLGFDPTTDYENIVSATFYMFEVLAGDQPIPAIIITDSEPESVTTEKTESEPLKDEEYEQVDHKIKKMLDNVSNKLDEDAIEMQSDNDIKNNEFKSKNVENLKYAHLKSPEPMTSKCPVTKETPTLLKDITKKSSVPLIEIEKTNIIANDHEVINENIMGNKIGKKTGSKNVSIKQENKYSKEEYLNKINEEIKLNKDTKLDLKNSDPNIKIIQDNKINYSLRVPDTKDKRIEVKYENVYLNLKKEQLQDEEEPANKKNDSESSNCKNNSGKSDKENNEKLQKASSLGNANGNRQTHFKTLKVNVERLTNSKINIHKNSITNKETSNDITSEDNIFQVPTSVPSNSSLLSKRKKEDNIQANAKKIKKGLFEDIASVKHTKIISSCRENFFNTQELLSVLTDTKEINEPSNLINMKDSASKGPLTRSKSFNEKSENETEKEPVLTKIGFTNEDIIIVDDDDDDEASNFPCSQLFQSSQEGETVNGVAEESNNNDDSLFLNIKQELEELDRTDFVPCIMLDSDVDTDWFSEEKNTTVQKIDSRQASDNVVLGTYNNFESNNVDILHYEETASLTNKSGNEGPCGTEDEHEQNLIIEEPHKILVSTEETTKELFKIPEHEHSTVPTSSFYLRAPSTKKYVVPPIVEPHRATRIRNGKKRECCSPQNELNKKHKKRPVEKTSPKCRTTKISRLAKTGSLNVQRKETYRDEIRKKVKEIALKNTDQKQKELISKKSAVKVKVSEGRGQFLLENSSHVVNNIRKVNTNNVLTKPSTKSLQSKRNEATSSKKTCNILNKKNINTTLTKPLRETPKTNGLNVTKKVPVNTLSSVDLKVKMDVSDIINQVINWSASWLSQQKNKSYSPQVNVRPPVEMRAKFSSYSDYYNVVIPLLLLELWNSLYKDWSHTSNDLRKTTFCSRIEDEQVVNNYTIMKGFTYIDKDRNTKGINIKEEDLIVYEVKSRHDNKKILRTGFGFVTFVSKRPVQEKDVVDCEVARLLGLAPDYCVNFTFKTKSYMDSTDRGSIMFVRLVSSMGPYLRLFKSVKYLQFSPLKEMVLNPKIENFKVGEVEPKRIFTDVKLNQSQLKAVTEATELCLGKKPGFYLIQGPPGTGKTTVITSIIQEIVLSTDGPPRCVLLAAPSNGAVDELVKRLIIIRQNLDDINRRKFKVIRVGPPNSIHSKVYQFSLEYMTKLNFSREVHRIFPEFSDKFLSLQQEIGELEKDCKKSNSRYERLQSAKKELENLFVINLGRKYFAELEKIRWSCLYNANVICTTLSSCFSMQMEAVFRNSGKITCCIVDEATQSNEQESLIPLMLGLEKIVLVGDPRQLSPTTLSQEAKQLKYGMSLFSRISNQFDDKPDNPIVMLDTQYRMHPEIAQFPSKIYYNNRLKNGLRCHKNRFKRIKPYIVFNLAMYCPVEQYRNENEVTFVIKLLSTIIELTSTMDPIDIGIITPYNNQKVKLNETLKECHFRSNVKVIANTVDSFQGQEKDVIIVSYVRMDSNSFVSDEHRLNVALTRAKHALFVVGNKFLFDTCSVLKKIRDNAQRRDLLYIVEDPNSLNLKQIISY